MQRILLIFTVLFSTSFLFAQESHHTSNYFTVKPIVSLIVSTENPEHAIQAMDAARTLSKKSVKVGNVLLVTKGDQALYFSSEHSIDKSKLKLNGSDQMNLALAEKYTSVLDQIGLANSQVSFDPSVIKQLKLSYSPTWIVRHEGKDYVFEGFSNIDRYFTREGVFNY